MKKKYNIIVERHENQNVGDILNSNLKLFNESKIGNYEAKPFCIYAIDKDNKVIGGVKGDIFGQLCRIFTVWVGENYRNNKLGTNLFKKLEELAKESNCKMMQVDTTEFQAKEFYENIGFAVFATLPDNFMGYKSYILRKLLFKDKAEIPKTEIDRFLQESLLMFLSAQELKNFPLLMKQGAILSHYAFELLLKACDIWENNSYLQSHDLIRLLKKVKFIKLTDDDKKQLKLINDYFHYRYPLSDMKFESMGKILEKNANEVIEGVLPLPCEIGAEDLKNAEVLYDNILKLMPDDLQIIKNGVIERINKNTLLI